MVPFELRQEIDFSNAGMIFQVGQLRWTEMVKKQIL